MQSDMRIINHQGVLGMTTSEIGGHALDLYESIKRSLATEAGRISLHDEVGAHASHLASSIESIFCSETDGSGDGSLGDRLERLDTAIAEMVGAQALLSYWGTQSNVHTLTLPFRIVLGCLSSASVHQRWSDLCWYPAIMLLYSGGVAAVAANSYENLSAFMLGIDQHSAEQGHSVTLMYRAISEMSKVSEAIKRIPGKERYRVPLSEHLFGLLRSSMGQLLWVREEYEAAFDRFEVLLSMEYASQRAGDQISHVWGPIGRFGWKAHGDADQSPLHRIIGEAKKLGESWPPIRAGLFGGSVERLDELMPKYQGFVERAAWTW